MKVLKKVFSITRKVLFALLIFMMLFMLVIKIKGENTSIFGFNMYYIASDSMEPSLKVGDIILSKNVKDYSELKKGDVITYQGKVGSYAGKLITHKIIDIEEKNGRYIFTTQGTKAGASVDPKVDESQVVAVKICKIPLLGSLVKLMNNTYVFLLVIIVPLAVVLMFEIARVVKILKGDEEEEEEVTNEEKN